MTNAIIEMPDALQTTATSALSVSALADFHEGLAMMEAGQGHEAVTALTRCLQQAPAFTAGHIWLGIAHAVTCSVYPAIDHLEKATELAPDNFAAHYTLAKYYFTLRIPHKGYEAAERALACAITSPERIALSQLLSKEREREHNGIARPLFNREFGIGFRVAALSGIAALLCAMVVHLR
jgi:tetratricopeptide (TPR) repeat protein